MYIHVYYACRLYIYDASIHKCVTLACWWALFKVQNNVCIYMEIHVLSTLVYEKKGNPPNHSPDKHIQHGTPGRQTGAVG